MQGVKIVCVSDLHGCLDYGRVADMAIRRKADILAIAGDIQNADIFRDTKSHFEREFLGMVNRLRHHGIDVVGTPGNHDFYIMSLLESGSGKIEGCPNILADKAVTIRGVKFWCTPWVPVISGRWAYEADESILSDWFAKIPKGIDVLISHTPPLGEGLSLESYDVSLDHGEGYWRHLGSRSLRIAIEEKMPKAVVCGHIHSGDHNLCRIANTAILNCSLLDERYQVAYKPSEILIEDGEMKFRTNGGVKWRKLTNWQKDT